MTHRKHRKPRDAKCYWTGSAEVRERERDRDRDRERERDAKCYWTVSAEVRVVYAVFVLVINHIIDGASLTSLPFYSPLYPPLHFPLLLPLLLLLVLLPFRPSWMND